MTKIKIVSGVYGHMPKDSKFITPARAGDVIEVEDEEATRLVTLNIAILVSDGLPTVATPDGGQNGVGEDYDPSGGESGAGDDDSTIDIVDGHFTAESLMPMTVANLKKLAADLRVDVSKCKNKTEIVAVLITVEVEAGGDDSTPPDLGAAPPVV